MADDSDLGGGPKSNHFEFQILASKPFQDQLEREKDSEVQGRVLKSIKKLSEGRSGWRPLQVKKILGGRPRRSLYSARITDSVRLLFEGPIGSGKYLEPVLFLHTFCDHDEYDRKIKVIAGAPLSEDGFQQHEFNPTMDFDEEISLPDDVAAFSKPIPPWALSSPQNIHDIMKTRRANLLLTQKQEEALKAPRPLLIHGHAGSGKSTILVHRLAQSVSAMEQLGVPKRIVFLSYNDKLVNQAAEDTREILEYRYSVPSDLGGIEFVPFQDFVRRYVPDPRTYKKEDYVPYGRFKRYYEKYSRGSPTTREIPAEVAWHGIRSILKGASIPPDRPPLSDERYVSLARKRRDFREGMFRKIYQIGEWYQREVIRGRGLWDDQDLAWAALDWVLRQKKSDSLPRLYDEILCDEIQDLTEIELRLLIALCTPTLNAAEEGLPLVLAGDPLQTINPTGFRWSVLGSDIYRVQGRSIGFHELAENFRSDRRIVEFAAEIQNIRSFHLDKPLVKQEAFEQDGEVPQVIVLESEDEIASIKTKLGTLPPESAVIVWPEDDKDVSKLAKTEDALHEVDRSLDLYKVSEAKGLEFRLVVLYKFGSSDEALKWKDYLSEPRPADLMDEIPLLYFLNRLYVSITRAKSFLFIVDEKAAVDDFWQEWKKTLDLVPRDEGIELLETHRAFLGDFTPGGWRRWADALSERAERSQDTRLYERARRAYEKAGQPQSVTKVDAKIAEIEERWGPAGALYTQINDFEKAGDAFERAGMWQEAFESYNRLPTTPTVRRRIEVARFRMNDGKNRRRAALDFFLWAKGDEGLEKEHLAILADSLMELGETEKAAQTYLLLAKRFHETDGYIRAAQAQYKSGNFGEAKDLFEQGEGTHLPEYELSKAETISETDPVDAIEIFFRHEKYDRVAQIVDEGIPDLRGAARTSLLRLCADSYFEVNRYDEAIERYQSLTRTRSIVADPSQLNAFQSRIGECFELMGRNKRALGWYRQAKRFGKAAQLAEKVGMPKEKILPLKIEAARDKGRFGDAIALARELGDEKIEHELRGLQKRHKRKYTEATEEFILAESWDKAFDSLSVEEMEFRTRYGLLCGMISAIAKSRRPLSKGVREEMVKLTHDVQEDPAWENFVTPLDLGLAYEKSSSLAGAAMFYESRMPEQWALEGWLRVKENQRRRYEKNGDEVRAKRVLSEIKNKKTRWSSKDV